jgi:hypothetical protein
MAGVISSDVIASRPKRAEANSTRDLSARVKRDCFAQFIPRLAKGKIRWLAMTHRLCGKPK